MARHGKRARPFNLRKVRINVAFALTALAAADLVSGAITAASANPYRVISTQLSYSIIDLAALTDDGHTVGLSHGDYSNVELEECLEAAGQIDVGNLVEQEQAKRLVRDIGQFIGYPTIGGSLSHNDGVPVKTKLNWRIGIGETLNMWVRNGSGVVWTVGAAVLVTGHIWIKDGL